MTGTVASCSHTCASVTKHYAAGEVTVGLALHASQTSVVYPAVGSRPKKGITAPVYTPRGGIFTLFFTLPYSG